MAKQRFYELEDVDEVERLRRVRRELEDQFETSDQFFDWLETLQRQHDKTQKPRQEKSRPAKRVEPSAKKK